MPGWSLYSDQPVDCSSRHSIEIVQHEDGLIPDSASHITVDYFYTNGRYWRAEIPLDGVHQVFGQAFNFSPVKTRKGKNGPETIFDSRGLPKRKINILNHLQSRFTFFPDQPVILRPMPGQETEGESAEPLKIFDVVYSVEATGPPGSTFNFRDAMGGNLVCAHRLVSTEEIVFERIAVENQYLSESPPLALEPGEERALLVKSLERSHRAGMNEPYYLYRPCGTNNCTSNPFMILDQVVNYTWLQWIGSQLYRLPLKPRLYLWIRGLDPDPKQFKLVKDEFKEFLADPALRQRKRDYVRRAIRARRAAVG